MATGPAAEDATGGQKAACVRTASSSAARPCGRRDDVAAVTSAVQSRGIHLEPQALNGPIATPASPTFVQLSQQQHVGEPNSVITQVGRPEQNLEEQRQEFMSRVERRKAYGAYLRHQADLRRQRDFLERLTRHNYSAGTRVSSTHEAFTASSVADTASVAAQAPVSKATWLTKSACPIPSLCTHQPQGNDGSSLSRQLLVQQQLLYQQQQCFLQQQQQQELLRQQREQQVLLQQQQQELLQQQQRLLRRRQPPEQKELQICPEHALEPRVTFATAQPQVREHHESGLYRHETSAAHHALAEAASAVTGHSTLAPATHASPATAAYPAAPGRNVTSADAATFDAELSPPPKETTYFPKIMSASLLHPAFPPRLRRVQPLSGSRLVTATTLELQEQQQRWRGCEEERRAYGEFLKRQIEQRKTAEKAEKELDKSLYGMGGGSRVTAGSLRRMCAGASAARRSSSEKACYDEKPQFCFRPSSNPPASAHCVQPAGGRGSTEKELGEASVRTKHEAGSNGDPRGSSRLESTLLKTSKEVFALDDSRPSNGYTRGKPSSTRAPSTSQPVRKMATERTSSIDEDTEAAAAACAAKEKKKKQQEHSEFLLMQIEQKRGGGEVAGRQDSPFPKQQAEKRFRSTSCCSSASAPVRDFDEVGCSEAVSSAAIASAKNWAAEGDRMAAPVTVETGQERLVSSVPPHSRRGSLGKGAALVQSSRGSLENAEVQPQSDEAQEEQQRLMREHERRKAYQAALLQQIREREKDRERQRREKMREQEKERQLLYEALEEERRTMRTGRKTVNNSVFTKKDTDAEEFTSVATTAAAELGTPCDLAASLEANHPEETEDCNGNAHTGRKLNMEADERVYAFGASLLADPTAAKQRSLRKYAAPTSTAALSQSASSAMMLCSPTVRKVQKQQQLETIMGLEANKKGDNVRTGAAALHGDGKGPELLGHLASCLQSVHLEMQRQQEELRTMKLQQQLSVLQQRVQQGELTRFLSALTHNKTRSTPRGLTASGPITAGGGATRTEGVNVCLENQHPLLLQPCMHPESLLLPCRAELCENSGGGPKLTTPSFLHGRCVARNGISTEEETAAMLAAVLAPAKETAQAGRPALDQHALSSEQDIGTSPIYTTSNTFSADLIREQEHQHLPQHYQHQQRHPLLQQNADMQHEQHGLNAKVAHLRETETDGSTTIHRNSLAPISRHDNGEEQCAGTGRLRDGSPAATRGPDKVVACVSPQRRLLSNRVNEIIDNFTRWLKPASFPKKEVREPPPRRSVSFSSCSSLSGASVMQTPPIEGYDAAANSLTFSQLLSHQQQDEQQHLHAQQMCSVCGALKGSSDCSSSAGRPLIEQQEDMRCCFAVARQPGNGVHNSQVLPSSLFPPATKERISCVKQRNSGWRLGCVNHLVAQRGSDPHGCNFPQAFQFTHTGLVTGRRAPDSNGNGRKRCVTCLSPATAPAVAATQRPSSCYGDAREPPLFCSCSYASKNNSASGWCPHISNSCGTVMARRHTFPLADGYLNNSMHEYMRPQEHTHACCFDARDTTNAALLLCPHGQQGLHMSCSVHRPQQELQTLRYAELQYQSQEEASEAGEPEQHERFVEIRDVQPLDAPSFVWSVDETEQQQKRAKQKEAASDFMRFSVDKDRHTLAAGKLDRSSRLAPPESRFLLRRWLGGVLPPPPSKDFPEEQQDQRQDAQQNQQEQAEGDQRQQPQRKEERRSLWRGGRNKAQQRGAVARMRSVAVAAAAVEKDRRDTSTAAGGNNSDKVDDIKKRIKSSLRARAATETTAPAEGKAEPADVGASGADGRLQTQGSSSSVKGLLGLLGHGWERRQRIEREKALDEEDAGPPAVRMSERMKMRLSWDADQPWDLLLQQGVTHGGRLLSATGAELQHSIEKNEREKQRRQRLQQQSRLEQLHWDREHAVVAFGPNTEAVEASAYRKKLLAPGDSPGTAQQKQHPPGWRRPSRSASERKRASTPQQRGNKSTQQQQQQKEQGVSDGSSNVAATKNEGETYSSAPSPADKHKNQSRGTKTPSHPQKEEPWRSPFASAPSTPGVPPEPHKKPEKINIRGKYTVHSKLAVPT